MISNIQQFVIKIHTCLRDGELKIQKSVIQYVFKLGFEIVFPFIVIRVNVGIPPPTWIWIPTPLRGVVARG